MSYVITDYTETVRYLVAINSTESGWVADPVIGFAIWRDMSPDNRGSENLLAPVLMSDAVDVQSSIHNARWEVEQSHLPDIIIQDEALYRAVGQGNVSVTLLADDTWEVSE